jgi:RAP domain
LNHKAPSLFKAIAKAAQVRINDFNPQALSNTAWAFATSNHEAPSLFDAIARAAQVRINDFDPRALSNMAWSFATLNHGAPTLLDAIANAAQVQINEFNPQDLANTAWAFATLNHGAPTLLDAIANAAQVQINEFKPQTLANMAWSFAVFNIQPDSFIPASSAFAQTFLSRDPSSFNVEGISQLHQFQLWCKEQTGASWLPDELRTLCRQVFVCAEAEPSQLQNDVAAALRAVQGVSQVQEEVLTQCGYSLDAAVVFQGNRIGVEVDGPSHFVGRSHSIKGSTLLKHRQLRALEDWKLVTIPYWEWNAINTGKARKEKKQRYLQNLLERATQ